MQDDGQPLRRRVPGDARSAPGPSTRPVLSPTVLRRACRRLSTPQKAEAALEDEQPTGPIPRVIDSSLNGANGAARHDTADTARGRTSRKGKRGQAAASSALRRRRRGSAAASGGTDPAQGSTATGTAPPQGRPAANGTQPPQPGPAQPAAPEKRPA